MATVSYPSRGPASPVAFSVVYLKICFSFTLLEEPGAQVKGLCVLKVITKRSNVFEGSAWILFADQKAEQDFSLKSRLYRWFPWWLRWLRICLQCGRSGFNPWVGKIPWRREQQPTPVLLPGEFHGQRSLAGYSPWVTKSWTRLSP